MTRNPETRNQARDRERAERNGTLLARKRNRAPRAWAQGPRERGPRDARAERIIEQRLAGMTPANRETVSQFLRDRRRRRVGPEHLAKYATVLGAAETFLNGTSWRELIPDQAGAWVDDTAKRVDPSTVQSYAIHVKALLRWMHDDQLPRAFRRALDTGPIRDEFRRRIVPTEHFLRLLHETRASFTHQALLWVLWDAGFRIEEALSLNVGSVEYDGEGVWLRLPPRGRARFRLKTGPWDVWVIQLKGAGSTVRKPAMRGRMDATARIG